MIILFADCFSGISGDMFLGALIDLGVDKEWLYSELSNLGLERFTFEIKTVKKGAINCTKFKVLYDDTIKKVRGIKEILEIIEKSNFNTYIKSHSKETFSLLARAEAHIHNIPVSEVHFHELGAIDSIVEILGTLMALNYLNIERLYSSSLPLGQGLVNTMHGPIPLPAPATLAILETVPVFYTNLKAELVTPTGAALIKQLANGFGVPPPLIIKKVGYGAGEMELPDRPNCLRLIMADVEEEMEQEYIQIVECDIDDMNPEFYPYIMNGLYEAGALDVSLSHLIMKKGRPGIRVTVLCETGSLEKMAHILLTETTSIGLRTQKIQRYKATRTVRTIHTLYGQVKIKCAFINDRLINYSPEYEDYSRIAREYTLPIKTVYHQIMSEAKKYFGHTRSDK